MVRGAYRNRFKYILVDEFQNTTFTKLHHPGRGPPQQCWGVNILTIRTRRSNSKY
jgi:hypothetical protein